MKIITSRAYLSFLCEVKARIAASRIQAIRSVNKELINLYWDLGKSIVERQEQYKWGDNVVEALARDLQVSFPDAHGFSERNVWNMRRFYEEYKDKPFLQQLVAEIPWGHNLLIMEKVSSDKEREYYIRSSRDFGWSRNVLSNQIKAGAFALSLKGKTHNFPKTLPAHLAEQADESIKSVYNLDFLGIAKPVLERDLEKRLIRAGAIPEGDTPALPSQKRSFRMQHLPHHQTRRILKYPAIIPALFASYIVGRQNASIWAEGEMQYEGFGTSGDY